MSIITSNSTEEKQLLNSMKIFFADFNVAKILRLCNCKKLKGIPVMVVFTYIFANIFKGSSLYMQLQTGSFTSKFSKNTYYRFLENARTNWLRFTTKLSAQIINTHIRKLTSDSRADCFIIDDTLYNRAGCKKTELASRVFDHTSGIYKKGFRLMTLGWSDGVSFLPINSALLASSDSKNILGRTKSIDKRTLQGKRRIMARQKGTDVCIKLLKYALKAGHKAKYVLFDTWFSSPCQLERIKDMGLDVIAMLKKNSRTGYIFDGKLQDLKEIYASRKKRRGPSRYKLSVTVNMNTESSFPARVVFLANRNNRKDWIAIICTDMSLDEDEIVRIYGKRWEIEVFFKTCKSFLGLCREYHGLSYDALTAHVAIVFARYMLLATEKRNSEDERTLGELFFLMCEEVEDISLAEAMRIIAEAMFCSLKEVIAASDEQLLILIDKFIGKLPKFYSSRLLGTTVG